ncbi:Protein kinase-like domain containing protein [Amanita muscaria]
MSLIRITRSLSDFLRKDKKETRHNKACKSMDDVVSITLTTPQDIGVKTPNTLRVDEKSFIEDFFQTYLDPSIVDVRRPIKYGLDVLPTLSVTASPTSIPLKHLNTPKELFIIPRTPLLPSTPAFEDSLSISYDGLPSPSTPSTTCSTPPLSPRTLDTSVASLDAAHTVTIDDFHLLQFLSKGGWGQVYLAKHTVSNRRLALKVMNREQKLFGHPVVKQLLIQERKIHMESLQGCDWFVQLEASWCDSNNLYIAMAYYPTDLESEIIRCETLPETRVCFYMAEIISDPALDHRIAQARHSVVHRDIKTGNILIRADGHIADDDASVILPRKPTELFFVTSNVTREMLGSEPEMAPEIVMVDHSSFGVDFWSAGVTLYVMLTGILSPPKHRRAS